MHDTQIRMIRELRLKVCGCAHVCAHVCMRLCVEGVSKVCRMCVENLCRSVETGAQRRGRRGAAPGAPVAFRVRGPGRRRYGVRLPLTPRAHWPRRSAPGRGLQATGVRPVCRLCADCPVTARPVPDDPRVPVRDPGMRIAAIASCVFVQFCHRDPDVLQQQFVGPCAFPKKAAHTRRRHAHTPHVAQEQKSKA